MSSIDPYQLLGVTSKSNIKELKKNYYSLALICHPDRGGNTNDMVTLYKAYLYVKQQLQFVSTSTFLSAEQDFKTFYESNKDIIPSYNETWKNSEHAAFLKKFNSSFEKQQLIQEANTQFNDGYGDYINDAEIIYEDELKSIIHTFLRQNSISTRLINHIFSFLNFNIKSFTTDITLYEEPTSYGTDFVTLSNLEDKPITDYSLNYNSLSTSDYKLAFSENHTTNINLDNRPSTLEDLVKEREEQLKSLHDS